jgi:hypothetical protein
VQESSEYETDSEDEANARQLLKPMFVPKAQRDVRYLSPVPADILMHSAATWSSWLQLWPIVRMMSDQ